jgi:hypothetical protein
LVILMKDGFLNVVHQVLLWRPQSRTWNQSHSNKGKSRNIFPCGVQERFLTSLPSIVLDQLIQLGLPSVFMHFPINSRNVVQEVEAVSWNEWSKGRGDHICDIQSSPQQKLYIKIYHVLKISIRTEEWRQFSISPWKVVIGEQIRVREARTV